jgi:hypothetical protein
MMHTAFIVGALLSCIVMAQSEAGGPKVVTVCEVLGNPNHYRDSVVAVVGRLDRSISLIDHYGHLAEDRCEKPVVTKGYVWPHTILIWSGGEDGLPKPPSDKPELDQILVAKQLSAVRQHTQLGVHKEPQFKQKEGSITFSHFADVPNQWAIVYGRVIGSPNLSREPCNNDEIGCRGFMGAPMAIIVEPQNIQVLNEDRTRRVASDKK